MSNTTHLNAPESFLAVEHQETITVYLLSVKQAPKYLYLTTRWCHAGGYTEYRFKVQDIDIVGFKVLDQVGDDSGIGNTEAWYAERAARHMARKHLEALAA